VVDAPPTRISVGIPLFLVTMASQNLAGLSVLHLHGYRPRLRSVLSGTGGISALIAPLGGLPSTWPRSPPP